MNCWSIYILDNRNVFKLKGYFVSMLKIKKLADMLEKQVYTDTGDFFGKVEEINVISNKIDGWRIVAKEASMINLLGGARGIIVPHQFVKAIGDVLIISKNAVPVQRQEEGMPVEDDII